MTPEQSHELDELKAEIERRSGMADTVRELRRVASDPRAVALLLGLGDRAQYSPACVLVLCPKHGEKTPSCSLRRHPKDQTLSVRCHGCGWTADVLGLYGHVRGLDFKESVRALAVDLGQFAIVDELDTVDRLYQRRAEIFEAAMAGKPRPSSASHGDRDYPPAEQIAAVWEASGPCAGDEEAAGMLAGRRIDPGLVDLFGLARVIPSGATLPRWARFDGKSWAETGHRLILPVFDATGAMRSVRAWNVRQGAEGPKRLPPAGHLCAGLILADAFGVAMLAGRNAAKRIVIAEGESDFLTWATNFSDADEDPPAVLSVFSGSWTSEIAARVPDGASVVAWTDHDDAGDEYARHIHQTLAPRCRVLRSRKEAA